MSDATPTATVPPKVDPETLVLRGRPGRVIRFRRGAIIAIAALASTAVVGVTWVALKPAALRVVAGADDSKDIASRGPEDVLAGAPRSYGDVPKLGPPLPGDLGRPILRHQQALGAVPPAGSADQAAQAAEAERQRIAAERKAARESGILMQLATPQRATARDASAAANPASGPAPMTSRATMPLDPVRDPGGQHRKAAFLADKDATGDINPHALIAPASPYMLTAGSIIAASLITGLNSDLPGLVIAQVTENAYDSVTGRILLIPQGSRLIGSYDHVVAFGQKRALVVWQRIVLPNGSSIRIDNVPATDLAGYAGLTDEVDGHTWQLLKGVALSTLLGVGTELSLSDESDLVRAIRESTQQGTSRAGDQIVTKNLNIQPTIKVRPGWPLRVVVHKDIVLTPWPGQER